MTNENTFRARPWVMALLVTALLCGGTLLATRAAAEPSLQRSGLEAAPHLGSERALFTLETAPGSLQLGDTLVATATLRTPTGAPLAGRRILFTYNAEWNRRSVLQTDALGRAVWRLPLMDRPDSSGFVPGGGSQNRGSDYLLTAIFFGDATYAREELNGFFKVAPTSAPRTSVALATLPASVTEGGALTFVAQARQGSGAPLVGATLRAQAFGREASCVTDSAGKCPLSLSPRMRPAGNYVVTLEFAGSGTPAFGGSVVNATVRLSSAVTPPAAAVPPLSYWGWDDFNENPAAFPYGPFGGVTSFHWADLVRGSYVTATDSVTLDETLLDAFLTQAMSTTITLPDGSRRPKPIVLGMTLSQGYADRSPAALKALLPPYRLTPPPTPSGPCPTVELPRYDHPAYQRWYQATVRALADYTRRHPQFAEVLVGWRVMGGYDGEWAVMFKNNNRYPGCDYVAAAQSTVTSSAWAAFRALAFDSWNQAFAALPVALHVETNHDPRARAYDRPMGSKFNGAEVEVLSYTYKSSNPYAAQRLMAHGWPDQPTAYESRYGPFFMSGGAPLNHPNSWGATYWMILWMLDARADWFDLHPDHWPAYANIPGLSSFASEHLGRGCDTSPSGWIVLREVADRNTKEAQGGWNSGTYGDYQFCLYRPELPQAAPVRGIDLPEAARHQFYTNPDGATRNATGTVTGMPGYTGRRTTGGSITLDLDDSLAFAGVNPKTQPHQWQIRVVYLDSGTDTFAIGYRDGDGGERRIAVRKANSGRWVEGLWTVSDLFANNGMAGSTDLALLDQGDGQEIFHRVQLRAATGFPPATPSPTPIPATPTPTPNAGPEPRTLSAATTAMSVTVDGQFEEWPLSTAWLPLTADTARAVHRAWPTPADNSAGMAALWDGSMLYLGVVVTDNVLVGNENADLWWDDSVEISLDGLHNHRGPGPDDHHYTVGLDARMIDFGLDLDPARGIRRAVRLRPGGYAIELAIPWRELLGAQPPASGQLLGLNVALHDDDDIGTWESYMIWESDTTGTVRPNWGHLLLVAPCSPPGDFSRNGEIDAADFVWLTQRWAARDATVGDFDGDGRLTALDFAHLGKRFGERCAAPAPMR